MKLKEVQFPSFLAPQSPSYLHLFTTPSIQLWSNSLSLISAGPSFSFCMITLFCQSLAPPSHFIWFITISTIGTSLSSPVGPSLLLPVCTCSGPLQVCSGTAQSGCSCSSVSRCIQMVPSEPPPVWTGCQRLQDAVGRSSDLKPTRRPHKQEHVMRIMN